MFTDFIISNKRHAINIYIPIIIYRAERAWFKTTQSSISVREEKAKDSRDLPCIIPFQTDSTRGRHNIDDAQ